MSSNDAPPRYPLPRDERCPYDPPPELMRRQGTEPLIRARIWDGNDLLLVTGYADQRALLTDTRVSADATHPAFPHQGPGTKTRRLRAPSLLTMDNPEHDINRRYLASHFTMKSVRSFLPRIQQIVDELIDRMLEASGPVDLVEQLAFPLPVRVTCELLGISYDKIDFIQRHTHLTGSTTVTADEVNASLDAMLDFLMEAIEARIGSEGEDVLSHLTRLHEAGTYSLKGAADYALQLLIAGTETTAKMAALGVMVLLEHPDQLDVLRSGQDQSLWVNAVEELLRYLNVNQSGIRRVTTEDIALGDHSIPADCGLIFAHDVGNRDPRVFDEPNRFDIHRQARGQVAFGFGIHQCLGQGFARLELTVLFESLFRRIPTLRMAVPREDITFQDDMIIYGVRELPVTWEGHAGPKIEVDQKGCVASGQCVMSAPSIFDQRDEDGVVVLLKDEVDPGEESSVREAIELCPARVIRLVE
jgi:cytochrome P450/ferredoxin